MMVTNADKGKRAGVDTPALARLKREVNKKLGGDDFLVSYDEEDDHFVVPYWISTGAPDLDYCLGGGIAGGRVVEVFSNNEAEGKSSVAAHIARECQKMGGLVVYFDSENTVVPKLFETYGVDTRGPFLFSFSRTLEAFFETVEATATIYREDEPTSPLLFILDSVAATATEDQEEADYDKSGVAGQARVMSNSLRKITSVLRQTKSTVLLVNQSRTKIGVMFGDPNDTPGGRAMKFYASQRIALRRSGKLTVDGKKDGKLLGIEVEAHVVKNKLAAPFEKSRFRLYFDSGIHWEDSAWDLLVRTEALKGGAGGRYTYVPLGRGGITRSGFSAFLGENPSVIDDVYKRVVPLSAIFSKVLLADPAPVEEVSPVEEEEPGE